MKTTTDTTEREVINSFRDDYYFLSNFYHSEIRYKGVEYPTVEHAYQAAKSNLMSDKTKIAAAKTPAMAKRLGRQVRIRYGWDEMKVGIMFALLKLKFQDPELRRRLLATGDAKLEEGNWWGDTFWGTCGGVGENHLGRLLMVLRDELRGS